jgi:hypothetical protein
MLRNISCSLYTPLGFAVASREDVVALIERAAEHGRQVLTPRGTYRVYAPGGGPELWVGSTTRNGRWRITSVTPHYAGPARMPFRMEKVVLDRNTRLEGMLYGWMAPDGDDVGPGMYEVEMAVPDAAVLKERLKGIRDGDVQVSALADRFAWFRDRDHFERASRKFGDRTMATRSFIPLGLFPPDPPSSRAWFCGEIERVSRKFNPDGGLYWHLLVSTLGGEVDVVAAPEQVGSEPEPGGLVQITAWLSVRSA